MALRERQNAAFAGYIAAVLADRNWKVADLIRKAGVSPTSSIRNVLTGKSRGTPKTLEKLAHALEVEPGALSVLYTRKPPKATAAPKAATAKEVTSTFAFTLLPDGRVRLVMDLPGVPMTVALQVLDVLKAAEIFVEGT